MPATSFSSFFTSAPEVRLDGAYEAGAVASCLLLGRVEGHLRERLLLGAVDLRARQPEVLQGFWLATSL